MKKIALIAVLVMSLMVLMAGVALANGGPHSAYSSNTDACAGCHVTHYGNGAKLLTAEGQTAFCYTCHGAGASQSSLDTEEGLNKKIVTGTKQDPTDPTSFIDIYAPTTAGGFNSSFTSIHTLNDANAIPGGGVGIAGGLQCGSCHNPHGSANARILKETVLGKNVSIQMHKSGNDQVIEYLSGSAGWCGACHDKFFKAQGSGHDKGTDTMYRHAMNVSATLPRTDGALNAAGTPLETNNIYDANDALVITPGTSNTVGCLTCHRAHGTTATVASTGYAAKWARGGNSFGTGSALLRMNERGVCYNCHIDNSNGIVNTAAPVSAQ